jgi:hypothetical protein
MAKGTRLLWFSARPVLSSETSLPFLKYHNGPDFPFRRAGRRCPIGSFNACKSQASIVGRMNNYEAAASVSV